ncbi:guanyl-specific ribonuclease Pb1 [Pyrenophora tritici-repentis]|uniref:ribonuclease T1 n=2 Tax=Pyrenophora tritici-repentis TaxID=45151 RepID=A0A2W1CUJ9_9PLEO|nr:guanyl-specific ribonuclease Pb1 [Pyrenophora tritici-repentis Pt-1C-BFP]KAA8618591.1 Guanyl-specific ribonuclease Pb1 [Pyrenophora tritici-repentis]EDU48451.1 guanyl-specific ribonuclease Pb1 [Pyrenophora tritici-repentis Pt-1C-BFP]KAF7449065.1 Guanyl-specific ribonuclease Pb1 [Pyrenophora tritici-repentis]KAF7570936.1 guanyl-specific ribonuclease Pb1 [Pyrenophora tritici-repentis]KAG9383995.1 Guanyl-specific ribonuclease Pb1 [Pyrenophora tritici-repentis]
MHFLTTLFLTLTPLALALPTSPPTSAIAVEPRQSCYATCGTVCYTSAQVSAAVKAGYGYYNNGDEAGSSTYPHTYNNYEGFNFPVSGPYQEFPLKKSGTYTGGSPGADRVIFNTKGQLAGEITHTGASGNNFVACT